MKADKIFMQYSSFIHVVTNAQVTLYEKRFFADGNRPLSKWALNSIPSVLIRGKPEIEENAM